MNGETSTANQENNVNAPAPIAGVVASFQSIEEAQQPTHAPTAGTQEMRKPTTTDDTPATYDGMEIITYGVRPSLYSIHIPTMHGPIWITHVGPPIDNDDKPVLAATNVHRDAGAWPKAQAENYLKAARTHWITATMRRAG